MRYRELSEGVKVYHGSRNEHSRFKIGHEGSNSHTFGNYNSTRFGVFFTNNPKFAAIYGDVDKYELSITKKEMADIDHTNLLWDFENYLAEIDHHEYMTVRHGRLKNWEYFENDIGEELHKWLTSKGYKAAFFEEFHEDDQGKEIKSKTIVLYDLTKVRRNPDPNQPDLFLK